MTVCGACFGGRHPECVRAHGDACDCSRCGPGSSVRAEQEAAPLADRMAPAYRRFIARLGDMTLYSDTFEYQLRLHRQTYPLVGVFASVDSDGGNARVTVTRVALLGVFALGAKKGRKATTYLTVAGSGWSIVREFNASDAMKARSFAAQINAAGQ